MPKLPPTSPAMTCTLLSGTFSTCLRKIRAESVHALRLGIERVVAAGRVVVADAAARLHRHGSDAVDHEAMAHDVVRAREGGVRRGLVAGEVNEADVVRAIVPHARRPGRHRIGGRGDAGSAS